MKQISKTMLLVLGFGLFAALLGPVPSRPVGADAPARDVKVVNTPLPVSITGTPTVNLGTGNSVGINGSVQVGNTATSPVPVRDVDNSGRHPFQSLLCFANGFVCEFPDRFTVASGKRLVIEYVSGFCRTGPAAGTVENVHLITTAGGAGGVHRFNDPKTVGYSSMSHFGQQARIYADPSTIVALGSDGASTTFACRAGQVIDCCEEVAELSGVSPS